MDTDTFYKEITYSGGSPFDVFEIGGISLAIDWPNWIVRSSSYLLHVAQFSYHS